MNCREFDQILEDLLDGELARPAAESARRHSSGCPRCRERLRDEEALRQALRALPAPPLPPDLPERVLARARKQTAFARPHGRNVASLALAASLALGIGVGVVLVGKVSTPGGPTQVDQVVLESAPATSQTVTLLYRTEEPLPGVTVTLRIPAHVALEGYGDRRELTWQTDLRAGQNVLRLPLVARAAGRGYVETELVRGDKRKTFRVELVVRPAPEFPTGTRLKLDAFNQV